MNFENITESEAYNMWKLTPPDLENEIHERRVSPDGKKFIGIYRVLYGYRIRAGYVGSPTVELDWCCGDIHAMVTLSYHMVLECLYMGIPFNELPPYSIKKPWYTDSDFCDKLGEVMIRYDK